MTRGYLIIPLTVLLFACSDSTQPSASSAPSFTAGVCTSISEWGDQLVDAANAFTTDSPHLNTDGRRSRYLFAFDEQRRITDDLRAQLEAAPPNGVSDADAARADLEQAVDDVNANIEAQKVDAAANVDFHFIGPKPDRLFAGTEKSLSLMLKPLDQVSRERHIDELGGSCGR